jgi:hypothetical protein
MGPSAAVGQTGGDRGEGGVEGDIGHDAYLEAVTIGRQYVETQLQSIGAIVEWGKHQNGGVRGSTADIKALASCCVDRR